MNIELSQGMVAIIDDDDAILVMSHTWYAYVSKHGEQVSTWYAGTNVKDTTGNYVRLTMHNLLMKPPSGFEVDHKNGNGLDNRRENLRVCTDAQNSQNRKKRFNSASRFKGVWFHKQYGTWRALIRVNGKLKIIGKYKTEEDAARAYDYEAVKNFGEFARLNFPDETPKEVQRWTRTNARRRRMEK